MKATGIVRQVDKLGRIVIPKELRGSLGIDEKDPLEIFVDGEFIMLRKYEPSCSFCGEASDLTEFQGKKICLECLEKIKYL